MKRRSFVLLGSLVVGLQTIGVLVTGVSAALTPVTVVITLVGALFLVGGYDPLPERVPGYYFIGSANLLLGLGLLVYGLGEAFRAGASPIAWGLIGVVGGGIIAYTGVMWFRDGWDGGGIGLGSGPAEPDK